jgi:hypothetical protein
VTGRSSPRLGGHQLVRPAVQGSDPEARDFLPLGALGEGIGGGNG